MTNNIEVICVGGEHLANTKNPKIMLRGIWNGVAKKKLVDLLHNLPCRVNLIRYHAKRPNSAVAEKEVEKFCDYLTAHGIITTVRKSRGEDILAACGMLVNEKQS